MPLARWAEHRPENCGRPRAPSRGEDKAWPIFRRASGPATLASRLSAQRYRVRSFVPCPRSQVRVAATRARTAIVRGCESPARDGQARAGDDRTTSFGSVAPGQGLIRPGHVGHLAPARMALRSGVFVYTQPRCTHDQRHALNDTQPPRGSWGLTLATVSKRVTEIPETSEQPRPLRVDVR